MPSPFASPAVIADDSEQPVPWLFLVTHEALTPGTDAAATLERCDLAPMMAMTGMIADHVSDVAHVPDGLELAVPQDDASCEAILDINAKAYGMDLAGGQALVGRRQGLLWPSLP
jgi:hypothetical protein